MKNFKNIIKENIIIIVMIIIALLFAVGMRMAEKSHGKNLRYETVIVTRGDSLWKIGIEKCPKHMDIRDWIDDVNIHNKINNDVYPGMEIEVLTDEKGEYKENEN